MSNTTLQNLHELIKTAFHNSEIKASNFTYIEIGVCQFHLLFEGGLFAFEANVDDISKPKIHRIKNQNDVSFGNALPYSDFNYFAINDIWNEGLMHQLFLAYNLGNISIYGLQIENYFLRKIISGYRSRESLALIACTKRRKGMTELPEWKVSIGKHEYEFKADNMSEASQLAKAFLDDNGIVYSALVHLKTQ